MRLIFNHMTTKNEERCQHCGGDIKIRNPKGYCDHLHYPEACEVCSAHKNEGEKYEQYYELEAVGHRIGLAKCLRCGATVLITNDGKDATEIHDKWHYLLNNVSPVL